MLSCPLAYALGKVVRHVRGCSGASAIANYVYRAVVCMGSFNDSRGFQYGLFVKGFKKELELINIVFNIFGHGPYHKNMIIIAPLKNYLLGYSGFGKYGRFIYLKLL